MIRDRTIGLAAIVIAVAVAAVPSTAGAGSAIEVLAGHSGVTLDFQIFGELMPRVRVFSRNRATTDYDANIGYYGFSDLFVHIIAGLSAATEIQHGTAGFVPRMGLAYSWRSHGLHLFGILTARCIDRSDFEFFGFVKYRPVITDRFHLVFVNELLINFGIRPDSEQSYRPGNGLNKFVERIRLGVGWGRYELAVAADLKRVGGADYVYNIGGAFRVTF